MDIIRRQMNTDINSIKQFNKDAIDLARKTFDDKDLIFNIRLILDELIINSYKHGNKKVYDRKINCLVLVDERYCLVKVKDEGCGIPLENETDFYSDHGRGLMLVRAISDSLVIKENAIAALIFNKNL